MEGVKVSGSVQTVRPYIQFVKEATTLTAFPLAHLAISHPASAFLWCSECLCADVHMHQSHLRTRGELSHSESK